MEQQILNIATIQPGEVFLVYLETDDSWDAERQEDVSPDADIYDFDYSMTRTIKYRKFDHNSELIGVVTDSDTYRTLLLRAEPYARKWEAFMRTQNEDKTNYEVVAKYSFVKEKHLVII